MHSSNLTPRLGAPSSTPFLSLESPSPSPSWPGCHPLIHQDPTGKTDCSLHPPNVFPPETFLEVPLESLSDFLDAPCRLGLGQSAPLACVHSGERFVHWLLLWFPCHTRTHSQLEEWNLMMQDDPKAVSIFILSVNLHPQSSPSLVGQKDQPRLSLTKGALGSLASGGTTRCPHPGWHQVFTHQTFVT